MRRLWTFQEGALAKDLWFSFRNTEIDLQDLCEAIETGPGPISYELIASDMRNQIQLNTGYYQSRSTIKGPLTTSNGRQRQGDSGPHIQTDLSAIAANISHRQVSKAEDEVLCIASLLDIDMEQITKSKSLEDRVRILWSLMPRAYGGIPKDIIFHPNARLVTKPYRWAPGTFLTTADKRIEVFGRYSRDASWTGEPTPYGLKVCLAGFILRSAQTVCNSLAAARALSKMKQRSGPVPARSIDGTWFWILNQGKPGENGRPDLELYNLLVDKHQDFALLLDQAFDDPGLDRNASSLEQRKRNGLVGELADNQDGIDIVETEFLVQVQRMNDTHAQLYRAAEICIDEDLRQQYLEAIARSNDEAIVDNNSQPTEAMMELEDQLQAFNYTIARNADLTEAFQSEHEAVSLMIRILIGDYTDIVQTFDGHKQWYVD